MDITKEQLEDAVDALRQFQSAMSAWRNNTPPIMTDAQRAAELRVIRQTLVSRMDKPGGLVRASQLPAETEAALTDIMALVNDIRVAAIANNTQPGEWPGGLTRPIVKAASKAGQDGKSDWSDESAATPILTPEMVMHGVVEVYKQAQRDTINASDFLAVWGGIMEAVEEAELETDDWIGVLIDGISDGYTSHTKHPRSDDDYLAAWSTIVSSKAAADDKANVYMRRIYDAIAAACKEGTTPTGVTMERWHHILNSSRPRLYVAMKAGLVELIARADDVAAERETDAQQLDDEQWSVVFEELRNKADHVLGDARAYEGELQLEVRKLEQGDQHTPAIDARDREILKVLIKARANERTNLRMKAREIAAALPVPVKVNSKLRERLSDMKKRKWIDNGRGGYVITPLGQQIASTESPGEAAAVVTSDIA